MKIGDKIFEDNCPKCSTKLIKKPGPRYIKAGKIPFSSFSLQCLKCKYETPRYKIREDYLHKKDAPIEDITPYKPGLFNRIFKRVLK